MEKLMQHSMIKMKKGEVHPLFQLDYLLENLASLAELITLSSLWVMGLMSILSLIINIFYKNPADSSLIYISNSGSTILLSAFKLTNSVSSNLLALIAISVTYYFMRRYFEYVKYNLHMLRVNNQLGQDK